MSSRRFPSPAAMCSSAIVRASFIFAGDDEPYDPTSPEHVAEREGDGGAGLTRECCPDRRSIRRPHHSVVAAWVAVVVWGR